jgi:hypothetical protein
MENRIEHERWISDNKNSKVKDKVQYRWTFLICINYEDFFTVIFWYIKNNKVKGEVQYRWTFLICINYEEVFDSYILIY